MDYKEQIKHPKWQKKRLEIMQKDNFTCQLCGEKDKTLNVHHLVYHDGAAIWDYKDWQLITLCEDCHTEEHKSYDLRLALNRLKERGLTNIELYFLLENVDVIIAGLGNEHFVDDFCCGCEASCGFPKGTFKRLADRRKQLKNNNTTI